MMKRTRNNRTLALLTLTAVGGGALGMGALMGPRIEREGDAQRLAQLHEMETKAFDTALFAGLSDWTHARALDASAIEGKVVLIGLVDSGNPQSLLALSTLARFERQNGERGLEVLAVHPELGWGQISEKVNAGRIRVQVAKDAGNAFANAISSDDAPDFYLIDRAGQLRYADIESRSLARGVGELLRETPEEAVENAKLQAAGIEIVADEPDRDEQKQPEERTLTSADYAQADWPSHNSGFKANDFQGKPLPAALGNEMWISEKKEIEGKVIVLDFWATWCGWCHKASPTLEEIQIEFDSKIEVLAIGGANDDEAKQRKYVYQSEKAYSHLYDRNDTVKNALAVTAIPHVVVLSTDGVIRWQGNPNNPRFKDIVKQVVEADPMFRGGSIGERTPASEPAAPTKPAVAPPPYAYERANWPAYNTGKLYAENHQGKKLPVALGNEQWLSEPRDLKGKVVMLDFWGTWCPDCTAFSPMADRMQKKYAGKLEVLAIGGQRDTEDEVRSHMDRHTVSYAHLFDEQQRLYKALNVTGIPHVVILSTDGVIRWQGFPADQAAFERVLDQIIAVDPMLSED